MANAVVRFMFPLEIAHIVIGFVRFREPASNAFSVGFIGQFAVPEARRMAFWFLTFGPLPMLAVALPIWLGQA
ncbi:MAG: DUF6463 family protein [Pseudomonadota bacterium]